MAERERWGSRLGLILAAAGNAIGIGNLLRFPGQAASNGGGAFMIPYAICFLLFGLPMMWIAWTIGRMGSRHGHGTTPGMFDRMSSSPLAKYFGVLGVALPLCFCLYYTYIESWCLGYSYFSLTEDYVSTSERHVDLAAYFTEFLGHAPTHDYFPGMTTALVFLLITLGLNVFVLWRGVAKGIELLAKVAVPLLFLFCVVLAVRVFTLVPEEGGSSAWAGLEFLWAPDFSKLRTVDIWVAAAGQIFFTLSIGFGSLECYASYLREEDDIALTGLTTASTNEFVEVIFGSLIAIPAAAVFFGADKIQNVAEGGTFSIGMITMPEVLRSFEGSVHIYGTIWFALLFLAAFTSSVAVCQPVMAFFGDEAKLKRGTAAMVVGIIWLLGTLPLVFFDKYGAVDEMDFWAGTIGLVVFSLIEAVLFSWIFGIGRGWDELHRGADIRVPRPFYYIMKYVTPVLLIGIFGWWFWERIRDDKLTPHPELRWAVMERDKFDGAFEKDALSDDGKQIVTFVKTKRKKVDDLTATDLDAFNADLKEPWNRERWDAAVSDVKIENRKKAFENSIVNLVGQAKRDLKFWATVRLSAAGPSVTAVEGDPDVRAIVTAEKLQEWISLQEYRYVPKGASDPGEATVRLAFEGVHRAPFIWLIRLMVASFTFVFVVSIAVIWRGRRRPRAEEGSSE